MAEAHSPIFVKRVYVYYPPGYYTTHHVFDVNAPVDDIEDFKKYVKDEHGKKATKILISLDCKQSIKLIDAK